MKLRRILITSCSVLLNVGQASCCVSVSSWQRFQQVVEEGTSPIVFCPFRIVKPANDHLTITQNTKISCSDPQRCILQGSGSHIHVVSGQASLTITSLVFQLASTSAIVYRFSKSERHHLIQNCVFRDNYGNLGNENRGGALWISPGNHVSIVGCRFQHNHARYGGAIDFSGSSLSIRRSTFQENLAFKGGAIFVSDGARSRVELLGSNFLNNRASQSPTGAITTGDLYQLELTLLNSNGVGNDGCDGVFDRKAKRCSLFDGLLPPIKFQLGQLRESELYGIRFSKGLTVRRIARSGHPVVFTSPRAQVTTSLIPFHFNPDGAATFPVDNGDGFVLVSNSEEENSAGGVYGLYFDQNGFVRDYTALLTSTSRNCNGGVTPWSTWVSCEEVPNGQCWQVDPQGRRRPSKTRIGGAEGGLFEALACDDRVPGAPVFFLTEDAENGALRRYRPPPGTLKWSMLHHPHGTIDYLEFLPNNSFRWTFSKQRGQQSAQKYFQYSEGIAHRNGMLMFVSKSQHELFRLNLDNLTYESESTKTPRFGEGPDHLLALSNGQLYFTEDGGSSPGIFVYDGVRYRSLLEATSPQFNDDETTGIAFSPDGRFLFFCLQDHGSCFQVQRSDGKPFTGKVLQWKYKLT